jgi:hypothetical protein
MWPGRCDSACRRTSRGLSGPIAGAVREFADRSARRLLERPRVQDAFVNASSAAQRQFVAVLDGDTTLLETTGGKVVLDVRPLVLDLGDRFSFIPDLESRIPAGAARVTILESDQLQTAQDATKLLRFVATGSGSLPSQPLPERSGSRADGGGARCVRSRSGS